jgi:hypothetical protein
MHPQLKIFNNTAWHRVMFEVHGQRRVIYIIWHVYSCDIDGGCSDENKFMSIHSMSMHSMSISWAYRFPSCSSSTLDISAITQEWRSQLVGRPSMKQTCWFLRELQKYPNKYIYIYILQLPEKLIGEFRRFERRFLVWSFNPSNTRRRAFAQKTCRQHSPFIFQVVACLPRKAC